MSPAVANEIPESRTSNRRSIYEAEPRMLPIHLSISQDIGDDLRFAESLCDKLADALAASDSLTTRLRTEIRNWRFKRVNAGPLTVERDSQRFLTSGSALLRQALTGVWPEFVGPARFTGSVFFSYTSGG